MRSFGQNIAAQNVMILDHLITIGPITPRQALDLYNCFRLGARIYDLRQAGHNIITMRVDNEFGNSYAEYHLLAQAKLQGVAA